jgi:predicted dehydrogenase
MAGQSLKLCMIGAGRHSSRNMYPYFHYLENAHVVANADLELDKAQRIAAPFGIPRSYTDYREMLDKEQPDGVMACVSAAFHAEVAVDVMRRGFHVYTEKPPAESLESVRKVLETQRETGLICMTGYKKHFAPAYAKAREIIYGDDFGAPALITMIRTKGPGEANYLLQWACHATDLMPFMFGPVARVSTFRTPGSTGAYAINMEFRNGAVGNLSITDRPGGAIEELTACGGGQMTVRVRNSIIMQAFRGDQPVAAHNPSFIASGHGHVEQGFVGELQEFVAAIREGREPESGIESSAHSMAVHDAAERSAESGRPEDVEQL